MEFIHNWLYLVLSVVGVYALISALRSKRQVSASQSWQGAQGKVVESRVEKRSSTDTDEHSTTSYDAFVLFENTVMGKEYTADRVVFRVKNSNPGPANEVVKRYPVDTSVMVYYNPDKPGKAVLERSSNSGWVQILVAIAWVVAGLYLAIK